MSSQSNPPPLATVLKNGRVIDPASGTDSVQDVVIENGWISKRGVGAAASLGENTDPERVRTIDCSEKWILPGLIDIHVHLREPGHEYKETIESGLRAAAVGGFTTVCPMPNTSPVNDTRAITELMLHCAARSHGARLFPFGAITRGLLGAELSDMSELREAGVVAVTDDGRCVTDPSVMRRALEYARSFDLLVSQHCEDHRMTKGSQMHEGAIATRLGLRGWPREAEDTIVARDIILAEQAGTRYHVAHISSMGAVRMVREAKARGLRVTAEVTPHHLSLTDEALLGYDTHCKVNPPLRTDADRAALREALADGTIDCIATDHAPHTPLEKDCEFDKASVGINGLETAVPILLSLVREGHLSAMRFVESLTTSPRAVLPELDGGTLREGSAADITVVDPDTEWVVSKESLLSKSHNTPLLDQTVTGAASHTFVGGKHVFERSR